MDNIRPANPYRTKIVGYYHPQQEAEIKAYDRGVSEGQLLLLEHLENILSADKNTINNGGTDGKP